MTPFTPQSHLRDPFFGRDEELVTIEEALADEGSRVGIYGAPGIGKSRLASRVAERWAEEGGSVTFVDGRATTDGASFIDALALRLELPPITHADGEAVITQIARALSERSGLLLVLDDVERHGQEVISLLDNPALSEKARVLLTSRAALQVSGVYHLDLPPLSTATAAELFETLARQARPDFSSSQLPDGVLKALLDRLDHLPLAIVLAAARLTILSPEGLLERLDRRFQILRPGHGVHDRSRMALDEAIGISWELLDDLQQITLAQCSVFEGGFDLHAAEHVVDLGQRDCWVGDLLQSLVLQSLVVTGRDDAGELRFYLLQSVADFARQAADSSLLQAARRRHAGYFFDAAHRWSAQVRGPGGHKPLARLLGESANLMAAFEELRPDEPNRALRLLFCLHPTYEVSGHPGTYLERIDSCRRPPAEEVDPTWPLARQALITGAMLASVGHLQEALQAVDEALENPGGDGELSPGESCLWRGRIQRDLGRIDDARGDWERGLEEEDDPVWRLQLLYELGLIELNRARFGANAAESTDALGRGTDLLGQAYELARRHTHSLYQARPTVGWALALHESGQSDRALRLLRDETDRQAEMGYRNNELFCLYYLSILEFYSHNFDQALAIAARVDGELAAAGLTARRARNTASMAVYANVAGRLDEAADYVARALDAVESTDQELTALIAEVQGVMLARERNDEAAMRAHIDRALVAAESVGSRSHAAYPLAYDSFLRAAGGDIEEARQICEEAIDRLRDSAEAQRPLERPSWQIIADAWRAILELSAADVYLEKGAWPPVYDAFEAVERLAQIPREPLTAVALRQANKIAADVRHRHGLPIHRPTHVLRFSAQGSAFQLDDQPSVDLSRRAPLRRILAALVDNALEHLPAVDLDAVVAAGWPGEDLESQSAANRVYSTIRMLRNMGLQDVIVTDEGGYRLAEDVLVL